MKSIPVLGDIVDLSSDSEDDVQITRVQVAPAKVLVQRTGGPSNSLVYNQNFFEYTKYHFKVLTIGSFSTKRDLATFCNCVDFSTKVDGVDTNRLNHV